MVSSGGTCVRVGMGVGAGIEVGFALRVGGGMGVAVGTGWVGAPASGVAADAGDGIRVPGFATAGVGVSTGVAAGMFWVPEVAAVMVEVASGSMAADGGASPRLHAPASNPNRITRQVTKNTFKKPLFVVVTS